MLSKLAHWSGYASILGGLLFGVAIVLHPLRDGITEIQFPVEPVRQTLTIIFTTSTI